jgi:hypothetical protein
LEGSWVAEEVEAFFGVLGFFLVSSPADADAAVVADDDDDDWDAPEVVTDGCFVDADAVVDDCFAVADLAVAVVAFASAASSPSSPRMTCDLCVCTCGACVNTSVRTGSEPWRKLETAVVAFFLCANSQSIDFLA